MSMPGFTAEASLDKTNEDYRTTWIVTALTTGAVVPQQQMVAPGPLSSNANIIPLCFCPCCACVISGFIVVCACC
jgi:hypothetical protein